MHTLKDCISALFASSPAVPSACAANATCFICCTTERALNFFRCEVQLLGTHRKFCLEMLVFVHQVHKVRGAVGIGGGQRVEELPTSQRS